MALGITLAIFFVALILFLLEKPRYDLLSICVLVALTILGVLTPTEAFAGLSSPAFLVLIACAIFAKAFAKTGLIAGTVKLLLSGGKKSESAILFLLVLGMGTLSAFLLNAPLVAAAMPVCISIAREKQLAPSRLLIPLAFGCLLGGTISLLGSSTNLGILSLLQTPLFASKYPEIRNISFFEFASIGLAALFVGALYFATLGRRFLPIHQPQKDFAEQVRVRHFLSEARVESNSNLVGKTLAQSELGARDQVFVLRVRRGGVVISSPGPSTQIEAGDFLLLQGEPENLLRLRELRQLVFQQEWQDQQAGFFPQEIHSMEAVVAPGCRHAGKTLVEIGFRNEYGLQVLALWRHGEVYPLGFQEMPLRVGDTLLVQGPQKDFERLQRDPDFLLTQEVEAEKPSTGSAIFTIATFLAAILLPLLGILDLSVSLLAGAVLIVLSRVLHLKEAYESIDLSLLALLLGMLGLASAFLKSGLDQSVSSFLVGMAPETGKSGFFIILLFALSALLAQMSRNQVAGILCLPIALALAAQTQMSPMSLIAPVWMGSCCSFLTPYGHPVNTMILGPGSYRYADYAKVGVVLLLFVASILFFWLL